MYILIFFCFYIQVMMKLKKLVNRIFFWKCETASLKVDAKEIKTCIYHHSVLSINLPLNLPLRQSKGYIKGVTLA